MVMQAALRSLIVCAFVVIASSSLALAGGTKDYMITFGDSISAGFISDTSAVKPSLADIDVDTTEQIALDGHSLLPTALEQQSGVSAHQFVLRIAQWFNHKKEYSWATGKKIISHYLRLHTALLQTDPTENLIPKNFAYSGGLSGDLANEARDMLLFRKLGLIGNIRYMTLLIGSNDVCSDFSADIVDKNVRAFFKKISVIQQEDPVRVLISSLPRIPDLGQPSILNHVLPNGDTCRNLYFKKDRYCPNLISWNTAEEYRDRLAKVEAVNEVLEKIALEVPALYPQFEVVFSYSFFNSPIQIERLAKDCFHPNEAGQSMIADKLWNDQPWWK